MTENQITRTLLYVGEEGEVSMDVIIDHERETMWATQKTMAEVFNVNVPAISKHLKNIFEEGELKKIQLFPKWKQLLWMVKNTKQISII